MVGESAGGLTAAAAGLLGHSPALARLGHSAVHFASLGYLLILDDGSCFVGAVPSLLGPWEALMGPVCPIGLKWESDSYNCQSYYLLL